MILTYRQCLEKYGTDYRIKKAIEAGILFQKENKKNDYSCFADLRVDTERMCGN